MSQSQQPSEEELLAMDDAAFPNPAADMVAAQRSMRTAIMIGVDPAVAARLYGFGATAIEALAPGGVPSVESNGAQEE